MNPSSFAPWPREDCIAYVKRHAAEELPMAEGVLQFILERLAVCRDPGGNMLRMLNEVRGAQGSWAQRHDPDRPNLIPNSLLRGQQIVAKRGRECDHCRSVFQPARSTARYCGDSCRVAAYRLGRGAAPAQVPIALAA
jgi:hypothetical protein